MWNHSIDFNLICTILQHVKGEINQIIKCLSIFETWKLQSDNIKKYEKNKKEFVERRCCNHQINLFYIFAAEKGLFSGTAIENAIMPTVNNGLPFVKKNKK
ncbi:hypothetical protein RFI_34919 [Reticulomyxa filosa]|uniref:Uncharacterized protein n=1 Tax=Reticulomyxa filosa TaxID=46433 RepID=X6LMZ2_RETFI|nr:hypothetical protein RFI_34919 [Reticulomyxa filosa]|eukprot:ETO02512.1 hypothetical protein RFI_34919 [Reticulomyxa filosa]